MASRPSSRHNSDLTQCAVDRRGADRQQPSPHLRDELQMTMPFHRFDQGRDQRLQPLTANPVGCFPEHDQRLANRIIVHTRRADLAPVRRPRRPPPSNRAACLRWKPVTATNSFSIWPRSVRLLRLYRSTIAATNSSRVAMLTRLIIHPAPNLRRATNQMRQQVPSRQHFRRGNAPLF